ncbi:MAG: hypothetical protein HQK79_14715 [Desulfobacterales bacterium]|nr:hypothetical protein [Desulfobacterales bacterium]MBF0397160.1 hypothetical protein [Desulfobacterales bacterium]
MLKIPDMSENEKNDKVVAILEIIKIQQDIIQQLKDEIAILKGEKQKPDIKK